MASVKGTLRVQFLILPSAMRSALASFCIKCTGTMMRPTETNQPVLTGIVFHANNVSVLASLHPVSDRPKKLTFGKLSECRSMPYEGLLFYDLIKN